MTTPTPLPADSPQDAPADTTPAATPAPVADPVTDTSTSTTDTTEPDDGPDTDPRLVKARNEARSLRTRLRDAEAAADTTSAALTAMQRTEAARLATGPERLADGADLWASGIELTDLLTEDSAVDPDKVHEAVLAVRAQHPAWGHRVTPPPSAQPRTEGPTWFEMLRDRGDMAGAVNSLAPGSGGSPEPTGWDAIVKGS